MKKKAENTLGDDLGASKTFAQTLRLEFMNIPFLRNLNSSVFAYLRYAYYPDFLRETKANTSFTHSILKYTRISYGLGISFRVPNDFSLLFYYNFANFNHRKFDIPRYGFGVSFSIY